jgi:hypothetical protein
MVVGCRGAPRGGAAEPPAPGWLAAQIKAFQDSANAPELVATYRYQGRLVYYVSPRCCDQYSLLYDSTGTTLCAPDGGITGRGDGRCPDFIVQRSDEKILWRRPPAASAPDHGEPDPAPPEPAEPDTTVPAQYRGEWAGRPAQCGRPSESFLRITADSVDFYESRGRVLAVDLIKERVIEVLLESAGEGRVWRQNRQFMISEDSTSLTDLTTEGHVVRVRCEAHR